MPNTRRHFIAAGSALSLCTLAAPTWAQASKGRKIVLGQSVPLLSLIHI